MGTLDTAAARTQLAIIREHLLSYGEIDKKTAMRICECDRLGARIYDLRTAGMDIITVRKSKKNRFGHNTIYAVYKYGGSNG